MATERTRVFGVKVSDEEMQRIDQLRERLQRRSGEHVRVTSRTVLLEALDRLEAHLDRLERDKGRDR